MSSPQRPSPEAIARKALRDDVYDALLEMLLSSDVAPGTPLSIDGLARDFAVSPTPVREALVELEQTGLVTRAAHKGYRVAEPLSTEQMSELIAARAVVEIAAIELAADRSQEIIADLRKAHARHAGLVAELGVLKDINDTSTLRRYFDADWAFHMVIMRAARNRYLERILDSLGAHVHRLRQVASGASDAEIALEEHARVLQALESGDRDAAVAAMRDHLDALRVRVAAGDGSG